MLIGIDPGQKSGMAIYINGRLDYLLTYSPTEILRAIEDMGEASDHLSLLVIYEDSRQQPIFSRGTNARAAGRIARSVGMIDGQCRDIEATCKRIGIECIGISPKAKGKKLNAQQFNLMTGWAGRTNSHERDAAQVAWPYRNFANGGK